MSSAAHVLYVDHQGHPCPLSRSYLATASRRLSSSLIDRHPPSTVTEIDSAFCPQCLSFHDVASAANLIYCPRPQCRRCPLCTAVASVAVEPSENECFYKCGYCKWTSKECTVTVNLVRSEDGTLGKEQIAKATEDLGKALEQRISDSNKPANDHSQNMAEAWGNIAQEEVKRKAQGNVVSHGTRRGLGEDGPKGWSIDSLEESTQVKRDKAKAEATQVVGGYELGHISLDEEPKKRDASLDDVSVNSFVLQSIVSAATPQSREDLLPLPIPLRARKSRRCRAELADGRPGILVKPKLNPLEGDSSLRTGHGQWWKKDSSAIHLVPKVVIVRHGGSDKRHALLLKVKNPTLGMVRLRFGPSDYKGEETWDGGGALEEVLEDLVVDSLTRTRISAKLNSDVMKGLSPTALVELDAVQDAFLELGKAKNKVPADVKSWEATSVLESSNVGTGSISSSLKLIEKQNDTAWFELVVNNELGGGADIFSAVPIALQIQVGEGSWESSLVKPSPVKDSDRDYVSFDLMIAWSNNA